MMEPGNFALRRDPEKQTVERVTIPMPTITSPDDVIISVAYAGICGTDLHILSGNFPGAPLNLIPGHETSGVVHDVGSDVTSLPIGSHVAVNPQTRCGRCDSCRRGEAEYCVTGSLATQCGIFRDGGWRRFWKVNRCQVERLPDNVPLTLGVLAEPLACVHQGWLRNGPMDIDHKILIMGTGIIGLLWSSLFHCRGYKNVTVSEPKQNRRELVKELVPDFKVLRPEDLSDKKDCFDLVVDCSGNVKAIESGFGLLKRKGIMNIFGCGGSDSRVSFCPIDFLLKDLTLVTTLISPYSLPKSIHLLGELHSRGYLNVNDLCMKIYNAKDKDNALLDLKAGHITKALLDMQSDT